MFGILTCKPDNLFTKFYNAYINNTIITQLLY